jgi:hypothetical protein
MALHQALMEATSGPARDQDHENSQPSFSRPSRWSLRTSKLRHSSTVVFLSNLYQLLLPTLPTNSYLVLFAEIIRQVYRVPITVCANGSYLRTFGSP